MKKFYPVTPELTEKLRQGKLTAAEWRIWSYLISVDPWGSQYKNVDTLTVMAICEVSKATYYRAIAKFDELGLFDFQDKGFSIKNRYGVASLRDETDTSLDSKNESQNCEKSLKNETTFSKMRRLSQICDNESPEPSPSLDSTTPKINKINKINKREREANFLKFLESTPGFRDFCIRKSQELPDRPVLIESWMIANFEELKGLWLKQQNSGVDQNSAAVEQPQKFPRVEEAIAAGELRQDSLYRDAVFDNLGNWWKKADWEARHEPAI
jgi:hypothetical protein